jgi:hypothetical protein
MALGSTKIILKKFYVKIFALRRRVLAIRAMAGATVGISRPSQCNMPIDYKPGRSKIRQKSAGFGISGKVPWHIAL